MPTIYIDKQSYQIREGLNLLQAALELGFNLPFFCWHPAMGSVGACRQCAVKQFRNAEDTKGRLVMACMTPAADNSYISIFDPDAVAFRASITEWMMMSHPHDCPVCDEGGECHLQDMTIMTGHNYRRFRGLKRTFRNQYLGPLVNQEMNRCIQCYRCVRFYRDYAGGDDFNAFSLHNTVFFGRSEEGILQSEFSGNLVEVCPTGVFTDKTFREHYARKWDLQTAPSICVNCAVGCNTLPGERYGTIRRIRNRYNGDVNGYFLCDRGRYGYGFVNSARRIRVPRGVNTVDGAPDGALAQQVAGLISTGERVIGIGSPRASLESNFALRQLVGADNFYHGVAGREHALVAQIIDILQHGPAHSPSLHEIATCDAVLVLGEDVSNTAPMIAYALRQSARQQPVKRATETHKIPVWDEYSLRLVIQNDHGPLFIATPGETRLDEIATATYRAAPQDIARLGFAVAHALDSAAPEVEGLTQDQQALAQQIADALRSAERPLILSGSSLGSPEVVQAAANAAWALASAGKPARLSYALTESNSMGLGLMGRKSLEEAFQAAQQGPVDALVVLENDLYRRAPREQVDALLQSTRSVIVLDYLENPLTEQAQVVLPAATFAESSGSLVNHEGRAQRYYQVFLPEGLVQDSWQWISALMADTPWENLDELQAAMAAALPVFQPLLEVAPPADYRIAGDKLSRKPTRYSGRTAVFANRTVHEPPPPADPNTPFTYQQGGARLEPPPALVQRFWAPGWNSIQSLNKFQQEIAGPLLGGNPGRRLIEPGAPKASGAEETQAYGKPFDAVPDLVGPGVKPQPGQPQEPPLEESPQQSSSPQTDEPQPNTRDVDAVEPTGEADYPQDTPDKQPSQSSRAPDQPQADPAIEQEQAPSQASSPGYFEQIPRRYEPEEGSWLVVPLYHVFGSEELSNHTEELAELSPQPYLAINYEDAAELQNTVLVITRPNAEPQVEGLDPDAFALLLDDVTYRLPAHFTTHLPRRVIGLPVGLPGIDAGSLPAYGVLRVVRPGEEKGTGGA